MSHTSFRWEAHACLPLHPQASFGPLLRFAENGVNYVSINVGMDMNPVEQVMSTIAGFRATIAAHPDKFALVGTVAEIDAAAAAGKLAIGFDLEGSMPLMDHPEMVSVYRELGVNQIHFAYNRNNSVSGGCHDTATGLTPLGHRMLDAVNTAGMLMDCSHTGRQSSLEIMAASNKPVIFSHANPLALVEHGRNITDEQIKACAATGGVVCVCGVSKFLGNDAPTAADIARHAAYVADLVGTAHVGIGLDISFHEPHLDDAPPNFDRAYWWPASAGYGGGGGGLSQISYTPIETWSLLPETLSAAGMNAAEVDQILGGNMRRVAQTVWG